jgi:hypothetical protein
VDAVMKLITDFESLSKPREVISLLCRLLTVAPVITGYLKLLLQIPEIDSLDISSEFDPDLFRRLIDEFFRSDVRFQRQILKLMQKGIPIDRRLQAHDELLCFTSQVLTLSGPGKLACASLVILGQLLPQEDDEEKAAAILQAAFMKFWRGCNEITEMTLVFELILMKHQSVGLITVEICAIFVQCVCEGFCVCPILRMFGSIIRWSERNANVLIEGGMIEVISKYCVSTSDYEIHRKFMVVIISLSDHYLRDAPDVLNCVKWIIDQAPVPAKIFAAIAYLKMLSLMCSEKRQEDLDESRIMMIMDLILCGTSGQIIDLTNGIHELIANDEMIKGRMLDLGLQEKLNEVDYDEINEEAVNAVRLLMKALLEMS